MADEIRVNTPTGNGGQLNLDLKQRSLGITGPVIIPVVCLLLIGVIGWLRSKDLTASIDQVNAQLLSLHTRQEQIRLELSEQTKEIVTALRENRDVTGSRLTEQNALLIEQTNEVRKHHAIIIYNQGHEVPQHLSLDLPLPAASPQR